MNSEYRSSIFLYENRLELFMDNEDLMLDKLGKKFVLPENSAGKTTIYYHLNDLNAGASLNEILYIDHWLQDKNEYRVLLSGAYNEYVHNFIRSEKDPHYPIQTVNTRTPETGINSAAVYIIDSTGICRHCWVLDAEQRNRSLLHLNALETLLN